MVFPDPPGPGGVGGSRYRAVRTSSRYVTPPKSDSYSDSSYQSVAARVIRAHRCTVSPRRAPTRTASLSPIDGLLLVRAGASLQPHTRQRRPATARQNAKKGLQHALRRRGLSPAAPLAQIAPSALVWVGAEGVGQLGSRVAREVERDSRCHSHLSGSHPPTLGAGRARERLLIGSTYVLLHHIRQFYRRASPGARGCLIEATHAPAQPASAWPSAWGTQSGTDTSIAMPLARSSHPERSSVGVGGGERAARGL